MDELVVGCAPTDKVSRHTWERSKSARTPRLAAFFFNRTFSTHA